MAQSKIKAPFRVRVAQNEITVTFKHKIPPERVADLLCCGFEGGVGYWCQIYGYKKGKPENLFCPKSLGEFRHIAYPMSPGYAMKLRDTENHEDTWVLNFTKVKKGLQVMAKKYPKHFENFINENEDSITGDVFIQCCLFGKLVYG